MIKPEVCFIVVERLCMSSDAFRSIVILTLMLIPSGHVVYQQLKS